MVDEKSHPLPIILIGPMMAGKSTLAPLLAEALTLPRVEMDDVRWEYYDRAGYDKEEAARVYHAPGGHTKILDYLKPFEAAAVEQIVLDYPNAVIDFGAGHSVYEEAALFERVQAALAPLKHVILILPDPDLTLSTTILNQRMTELLKREGVPESPDVLAVNEHFVRHPGNHALATHTFYTEGKTPEQVVGEMLEVISG